MTAEVEESPAAEKARDKRILNKAFDRLEEETPDLVTRAIHWLRAPEARWIRIPVGLLCIAASFFFYLPVVGLEFLPIGLLFIAQDVPFLRRPVGKFMLWLENKWKAFKTPLKKTEDAPNQASKEHKKRATAARKR